MLCAVRRIIALSPQLILEFHVQTHVQRLAYYDLVFVSFYRTQPIQPFFYPTAHAQ